MSPDSFHSPFSCWEKGVREMREVGYLALAGIPAAAREGSAGGLAKKTSSVASNWRPIITTNRLLKFPLKSRNTELKIGPKPNAVVCTGPKAPMMVP